MTSYIDFRSDTVTRPSSQMLNAMTSAELGDDVYGDDSTVNSLEQRMAELTGFEAAMIVSSGTQSNLCALLSHCQRGEEYIVGQHYHTYLYEAGGAAALGGIVPQPIAVADNGSLDPDTIKAVIKPDDQHFAMTKLISLENTHHGKVIPLEYFKSIRELANDNQLSIHLDGARVFNALTELNIDLKQLCQYVDSVSICFSKGLGTPMGSVLCGNQAFIHAARRWRKMLGGGMRQAGLIAAAMNYALDHHVSDLATDHQRCQDLKSRLQDINGITITACDTNMLYFKFSDNINPALIAQLLKAEGILISAGKEIRLVCHRDISDADVIYFTQTLEDVLTMISEVNQ
ncbi:low-specificity L-threonine aldolase [Thalassotalea mangrovi]|uniref:Low-specificity L-threonine aldolase n=1 Tax=Thalassotalea mangrovi TaxID=2572245 RepID=A0A4U1B4L4_9GAMM|nr:low-specificity L-threonine aldolase [Thalassotalea mangrovi]TKB45127.1 low-specificity L-threonine aldolase [Thalassotalea mangrovi]